MRIGRGWRASWIGCLRARRRMHRRRRLPTRLAQCDRRFGRARRASRSAAAQVRLRRGAADRRASRGDREGAAGASADRRVRRDRLRQDDAAAEDLPRGRPRHARPDRSHAAATHRRPRARQPRRRRDRHDRRRARSATRCASTIAPGRDTRLKLMTDGILLRELEQRPRSCATTTR